MMPFHIDCALSIWTTAAQNARVLRFPAMRPVVASGSRFIESKLCENLINQGNKVPCVDYPSLGNHANVIHLLPVSEFSFIEHRIVGPRDLEANAIATLRASPRVRANRRMPLGR